MHKFTLVVKTSVKNYSYQNEQLHPKYRIIICQTGLRQPILKRSKYFEKLYKREEH